MLLASRAGVQARTLDLATHGVTPHPKRATSTASPLPHSSLSFYFFTFGDMPGKAHPGQAICASGYCICFNYRALPETRAPVMRSGAMETHRLSHALLCCSVPRLSLTNHTGTVSPPAPGRERAIPLVGWHSSGLALKDRAASRRLGMKRQASAWELSTGLPPGACITIS